MLGADAALRDVSSSDLDQALIEAKIDPAVKAAILSGDQAQLELLLGCRTNVCCGVFPGKEEEDETEEEPLKDDEEVVARRSVRNVA